MKKQVGKPLFITNNTTKNMETLKNVNSLNKQPVEQWNTIPGTNVEYNRPCVFKLVTGEGTTISSQYGYFVYKGIACSDPYLLSQCKKNGGDIQWKYIDTCKGLDKCPNGFPCCNICK